MTYYVSSRTLNLTNYLHLTEYISFEPSGLRGSNPLNHVIVTFSLKQQQNLVKSPIWG